MEKAGVRNITNCKRNIIPNVSCELLEDFKHFFPYIPVLKYLSIF